MSHLNEQIKVAIDGGNTEQARTLLRDAMPEANAETYFLASQVALSEKQKQDFLNKAIELDPFYEEARAMLKRSAQTPAPVSPQSPLPQSAPVAEAMPSTTIPEHRNNLFDVSSWIFWASLALIILGIAIPIIEAWRFNQGQENCDQYGVTTDAWSACSRRNTERILADSRNADEQQLRLFLMIGGGVALGGLSYGIFLFAKHQDITALKAQYNNGQFDSETYRVELARTKAMTWSSPKRSLAVLFREKDN